MGTSAIYKFKQSNISFFDSHDGYEEGAADKLLKAISSTKPGNLAERFFRENKNTSIILNKENYGEEFSYLIEEKGKKLRRTHNDSTSSWYPLHEFVNQYADASLIEKSAATYLEEFNGYYIDIDRASLFVNDTYSIESLTSVLLNGVLSKDHGNITSKVIRENQSIYFKGRDFTPDISYDSTLDKLIVAGESYTLGAFLSLHSDNSFTKIMGSTVTIQQAMVHFSSAFDRALKMHEGGGIGNSSSMMGDIWRQMNEAELNSPQIKDQLVEFREKILSHDSEFVIAYQWPEKTAKSLDECVADWRKSFRETTDERLEKEASNRGLSVHINQDKVNMYRDDKAIIIDLSKKEAFDAINGYASLPSFYMKSANADEVIIDFNHQEYALDYSDDNYTIIDSEKNQEVINILRDNMAPGIFIKDIIINNINEKLEYAFKNFSDFQDADRLKR